MPIESSPSASASPVTLAAMEYRVVKSLGVGAGSTILQVVDKAGGPAYALKVVKRQDAGDDIYVAQVQNEYDILGMLDHRTIPKAFDLRVKRKWFRVTGVELLMELIDGRSLEDVETRDVGQLVLVFSQIASGLTHMHRRGVYHGDLKPSNVMLTRAGGVKIIDFGTAWIKGQFKDRVQGTPQYMAPEQAGMKVVDERTDLYNFGALMYRLLTGEYANFGVTGGDKQSLEMLSSFDGNALKGARPRINPPMALNDDVPGTLNETIMACLEANRDRRPAGAFEVKNQLKAVAKYLGVGKKDLWGSEGEDG